MGFCTVGPARQCNGRVFSDEPEKEDDDSHPDSFCDVRFDRKDKKSQKVCSIPPRACLSCVKCGDSAYRVVELRGRSLPVSMGCAATGAVSLSLDWQGVL